MVPRGRSGLQFFWKRSDWSDMGIGSVLLALAAGVPIVLAPMFADQLTALATGRTRTA